MADNNLWLKLFQQIVFFVDINKDEQLVRRSDRLLMEVSKRIIMIWELLEIYQIRK